MRTKTIVIAILVIIASFAFGQDRIDVIHLKNGDLVKGVIVENVPNDYVRVELQGGSILTYKYNEIEKFTKEIKPTSAPPQTQPSYNTDAQKMMMYESQKKNSTTAVVLSCLLSSTGHAYAGNWGRGLLFTGGRIGCAVFAVTAGIEEKTEYDPYWGYETTTTEVTGAYTLGMLGAAVLAIWEMVDASNEVKKYNQKLYNRIYSGQPDFGFNIIPNQDGAQLMLTYNF